MKKLKAKDGIRLAYMYAKSLGYHKKLNLNQICELYHCYQNSLSHLN